MVGAFFCDEVVVRTLLKDITLAEDDDVVCIFDRAQAVSDHHDSHLVSTGHQLVESLLDLVLRLSVKSRSSLIEQQHARLADQSSCDGDALLLPTGHLDTTLTHDSLLTFGEESLVVHKSKDLRLLTSLLEPFLDLSFGKVSKGAAIHDVFADGSGEERRFLLDDGDLVLMVPLVVNVFKVDIVVEQFTSLRVVEPLNQLHHR